MPLHVHLDKASERWTKAFPLMRGKIEKASAAAYKAAKKPEAFRRRSFAVNVILTDDSNVKSLNKTYRGQNKPTNVLSFPQINVRTFRRSAFDMFPARSTIPLGDVVLAHQTIRRECREQEKPLENHVIHLIVHGVLHLMGYDHMRPREAKDMEKLECDILESLGYPDPYHDTYIEKTRTTKTGR